MKVNYMISFNYGYFDFGINNILNYIDVIKSPKNTLSIVCMDEKCYNEIDKFLNSITCDRSFIELLSNFKNYSEFENFNSKAFINITNNKIQNIYNLLKNNEIIHFFDSDVFFFKDPTDLILEDLLKYDIVFQQDAPAAHHNNRYHNYVCTGNFSIKRNENTISFFEKVIEHHDGAKNDQEIVYQLLNEKCSNIRNYPDCRLHAYDQKLFQNGYDSFNNNWYSLEETVSIHANHMIGKENKKNALIKANAWYDV